VSNIQVPDEPGLEIAGQLERALEQRWQELSARRYSSPCRAVADLTRDGEGILETAGLEGVPPFPGCLKIGCGNGSSNSDLRLYSCTALTRANGDQALVIHLKVELAQAGSDQELTLEQMLVGCPEVRVVSPGSTG
jgi:hypothetical protein